MKTGVGGALKDMFLVVFTMRAQETLLGLLGRKGHDVLSKCLRPFPTTGYINLILI